MISPIQYFVGGGFTITGLVILLLGWRDFRQQRTFLRQSKRATGVVVGTHLEGPDLDEIVYRHPTIRFVTETGTEITFTAPFGRSKPWADGQQVPVRYRPDQPDRAELDSFFSIWLTTLICAVIGTVMLASGLLLVFVPPETDFETCEHRLLTAYGDEKHSS